MAAICAVLAAAAARGARPASSPTSQPVKPIAVKPKTKVTFQVEPAGETPAGLRRFALSRVVRDGLPVATPRDMKLDPATGAFSWTPRVSQAGTYALTFLVQDRSTPLGRRVERRVTVEAGEITTDRGEAGKRLRKWYADGTAAGNIGDFYDNRDRGHSHLRMAKFPQLDKVEYPEAVKQRRLDWGLQLRFLFRHVTFGNSSTAAGPTAGGCNSRRALMGQRTADVLHKQYKNAHLYIYPEHRDHDAGTNGRGGYGDLFPANVPYLITSQGSSGSDRAFMEAVALTLAAFRPEVKKRLIASGLLMPTVQMILRSCAKNAKHRQDYLTGKAHPTAFVGHNVDPAAMVRLAHEIRVDTIPPMVQLAVVQEDGAKQGRDYFDPRPEKLFDTPCAVARICRSTKHLRRMVVSARGSYDVSGRKLTYRWAVLRGDAERIRIRPRNKEASEIELLVPYHERRPVQEGAKLQSTRVDIGCFVHNGEHDSAPGFVCFYWLADEARTYGDDGRILDVGYDLGDSTIGYDTDRPRRAGYDITDWKGLLELAGGDGKGFGATLLRKPFGKRELAELRAAAGELADDDADEAAPKKAQDEADAARKDARQAVDRAKKDLDGAKKAHAKEPTDETKADVERAERALKQAEEARQRADKLSADARRDLLNAQRAGGDILTRRRAALAGSVKDRIEAALNAAKDDVGLYVANQGAIDALARACRDAGRQKAFAAARDDLLRRGVLEAESKGRCRLSPILDGPEPAARRLTRYERNRIEWFHVAVLRELVLPGMLKRSFQRNFVHPMLAAPKNWRDVYRYEAGGRLVGWTRHRKGKKEQFTADGALVTKTDKLGRAVEARAVQYIVDRDSRGRPRELKYMTLPKVLRYEYASDADRVGRVRKDE